MRLVWVWALLLCGLTGPVLADPMRVVAGEHADFSRIVFYFGETVDWALGRAPAGYVLRYEGPPRDPNMAAIFDRIPRDRLRAILHDGEKRQFTLVTDCPCHADAFVFRPGILVVDLKDGGPDDAAAFETPLDPTQGAAPERLVLPTVLARPTRVVPLIPPEDGRTDSPDLDPDLQASLLAQFSRATAQGLVTPAQALPIAPADPAPAPEPATAPPTDPVPDPLADPAPGLQAFTQQDLDRAIFDPTTEAPPHACVAAGLVDVGTWGGDAPDLGYLGTLRRGLVDGSLRMDAQALLDLGRHYIWLGFGREAALVAAQGRALAPDLAAEWAMLDALADVLDKRASAQAAQLASQLACGVEHALWALLAQTPPSTLTKAQGDSVQRAFAALPAHLRTLLAADVGAALDRAGQGDAAQAVRAIAARVTSGSARAAALALARDALENGETAQALSQLLPLIDGADSLATEALELFVRQSLGQGLPLPQTVDQALRTAIFQMRGTDAGARLLRLAVAVDLAADRFAQVFAALQDLPDMAQGPTGTRAWQALLAKGTDADFAQITARYGLAEGAIPQDLRAGMAERLLQMGLADMATRISGAATPTAPAPTGRADAAQAMPPSDRAGEPDKTAALLADLPQFDADLIAGTGSTVSLDATTQILAVSQERRARLVQMLDLFPAPSD